MKRISGTSETRKAILTKDMTVSGLFFLNYIISCVYQKCFKL